MPTLTRSASTATPRRHAACSLPVFLNPAAQQSPPQAQVAADAPAVPALHADIRKMNKNFYSGRKALITGGSSGIGFALANQIVAAGGSVAILARNAQKLSAAANSLEENRQSPNQGIWQIEADVTQPVQLNSALDQWKAEQGVPDIVINCAGDAHPASFVSTDPEVFHQMMDVNYFGTVNVLKNLVPGMRERRSGMIINISSMAGIIGVYGYTAYGASKFAVSGFSDVLRSELKPYNVQVSVVFPPDTQTPQLDAENRIKPFITKEVGGSSGVMTADAVASEILDKAARGKYIILPGSEAKLLYTAHNLLGRNLYPVMDLLVRNAIGKLKFGKG